ncbi:MAG: EamA family transporter RarD [Rhodospirillales bacterium]|nr:EamA family transporter RarD [Rhodospirillales bacterium]
MRWGIGYSVAAYLLWGLFPIYFNAVATVPPFQVLAHRIVLSFVLLCAVVVVRGNWRGIVDALRSPRTAVSLFASASAIAANWGVFIWAVDAGHVLECSLGYFISPLVSVVLGVAVLKERLRRVQWLAVGLAGGAVVYQLAEFGVVPWVALSLAGSFATYGLLRKTVRIDPVGGLAVEAMMLMPVAFAFLVSAGIEGSGAFAARGWETDVLLMGAGPITVLPLILFVAGARRSRLATVGLLQYITPCAHFLLAVALFGEPVSRSGLTTFVCIWAALAMYSIDLLRRGHRS